MSRDESSQEPKQRMPVPVTNPLSRTDNSRIDAKNLQKSPYCADTRWISREASLSSFSGNTFKELLPLCVDAKCPSADSEIMTNKTNGEKIKDICYMSEQRKAPKQLPKDSEEKEDGSAIESRDNKKMKLVVSKVVSPALKESSLYSCTQPYSLSSLLLQFLSARDVLALEEKLSCTDIKSQLLITEQQFVLDFMTSSATVVGTASAPMDRIERIVIGPHASIPSYFFMLIQMQRGERKKESAAIFKSSAQILLEVIYAPSSLDRFYLELVALFNTSAVVVKVGDERDVYQMLEMNTQRHISPRIRRRVCTSNDDDGELAVCTTAPTYRDTLAMQSHKALFVYRFNRRIAYTITEEEFLRLQDRSAYLNDTLIDFFLRYFHSKSNFEHKILLANSFLFRNLQDGRMEEKALAIFAFDYIVIPVNESMPSACLTAHNGSLCPDNAIGAPLSLMTPNDRANMIEATSKRRETKICIFDSLGGRHKLRAIKTLKRFIEEEASRTFHGKQVCDVSRIVARYINAPAQENSVDCGIFLLNYAHMFFQSPNAVAQLIEDRISFKNWFSPQEMKYTRSALLELLKELGQTCSESLPEESSEGEDDCMLIDSF